MCILNQKIISLLMVSLSIAFVAEAAAARRGPVSGPVKCFSIPTPAPQSAPGRFMPLAVATSAAATKPPVAGMVVASGGTKFTPDQEDLKREEIRLELVRCFELECSEPPAPFIIEGPCSGEALIMANQPLKGFDYHDEERSCYYQFNYAEREKRLLWLISCGANPEVKGFDGFSVLDDTDNDEDLAASVPSYEEDDCLTGEGVLKAMEQSLFGFYPSDCPTLADTLRAAYTRASEAKTVEIERIVANIAAEQRVLAACLPVGLMD